MKKKFLLIVLLLVVLLIIIFICLKNQSQVCFGDYCFVVELAKTAQGKERGLMFKEKLDPNKGMLFIFEDREEASFWMKNTLIALDIIWINENKEVVYISKNNQPCKTDVCFSINPDIKAKYVLELNGGTTDKIGLEVGDKAVFIRDFRILSFR